MRNSAWLPCGISSAEADSVNATIATANRTRGLPDFMLTDPLTLSRVAAVLRRRYPNHSLKRPVEMAVVRESRSSGDLGEGRFGISQFAAGKFDAQPAQIFADGAMVESAECLRDVYRMRVG